MIGDTNHKTLPRALLQNVVQDFVRVSMIGSSFGIGHDVKLYFVYFDVASRKVRSKEFMCQRKGRAGSFATHQLQVNKKNRS